MPKPKYEMIIYWSDEDQAFIAEVPELPGCAPTGRRIVGLCTTSKALFKSGSKRPAILAAPFQSQRADWYLLKLAIPDN